MTTGDSNTSQTTPPSTLVVGATSSLMQALCRKLAQRNHSLILCGRDEKELRLLGDDLAARFNIECSTMVVDLIAPNFSPTSFIAHAGFFDNIIIATGDMGEGDVDNPAALRYLTEINYVLPAQIATAAAQHMKRGSIILVSSVAGDRGRKSNYLYGSAKAALSTFASGLRNRFAKQDLHVMTVKPGFIDTPMTWGMNSPLIASREYVAEKIADAMEKKKDVIYVPWFWRWIMLIIMHIPERIFKKLSL